MKLLMVILVLALPLLRPFIATAKGEDGAAGDAFSYTFRALLSANLQYPADSTQNPDNAFLRLYRWSGELDFRPDFFWEQSYLSAMIKPRVTGSYRRWEDGVARGETDSSGRFFLNEWMVRPKPLDTLFFSFGKQKMLWGPSFLVSPSNILFKDTEKINPKAEVEGTYMAQVIYMPGQTITVTGLSETSKQEEFPGEPEQPVRAVKLDVLGQSYQVSLITYFRRHDRFRIGSFGQWTASDAVLLYYDGIVTKGTDALFPVQNTTNPLEGEFKQRYGESSHLFTTVAAGGSYTFLSGETINLEFLYNGPGCGDTEAEDYYELRRNASSVFLDTGPIGALSEKTLAESLNTGSAFLRRYYLMAQVQKREIKNVLDIMLRYVHGIEEHAGQISSILEWKMSDRIEVFNINMISVGGAETEFRSIIDQSFLAGIEVHF
jgi:hypothetical protein